MYCAAQSTILFICCNLHLAFVFTLNDICFVRHINFTIKHDMLNIMFYFYYWLLTSAFSNKWLIFKSDVKYCKYGLHNKSFACWSLWINCNLPLLPAIVEFTYLLTILIITWKLLMINYLNYCFKFHILLFVFCCYLVFHFSYIMIIRRDIFSN